jgi:hypothetical protein
MNTRAILLAGAAILSAVVLAAAGVFLLLAWWGVPAGAARVNAQHAPAGDGAGLRSAPQQDLAAYRAAKERRLHGFGWVDAQHGIAHIPIEEAMALMSAEGTR